jgi:hypothetical protein
MILGCRLEHLRNANVTVNGHIYLVGDNGICLDVADEDAASLLASPQWYRVGATTEGPIDYTRERSTPEATIPKTAGGQLAAIGLPPDWRAHTASPAPEPYPEPAQQQPMHPVTPSQAAPVAPAVAAGAAYTPGIPPVEAPTLDEMSAQKSKRRGRPKKA